METRSPSGYCQRPTPMLPRFSSPALGRFQQTVDGFHVVGKEPPDVVPLDVKVLTGKHVLEPGSCYQGPGQSRRMKPSSTSSRKTFRYDCSVRASHASQTRSL